MLFREKDRGLMRDRRVELNDQGLPCATPPREVKAARFSPPFFVFFLR
jgi:hypothetical protein